MKLHVFQTAIIIYYFDENNVKCVDLFIFVVRPDASFIAYNTRVHSVSEVYQFLESETRIRMECVRLHTGAPQNMNEQ